MGLGSTGGERGYPDWQRVSNWDGPVFYSANAVLHKGSAALPAPINVDRYSSVEGKIRALKNPVKVTFVWLSAASGGVTIATRRFEVDPLIVNACNLHLPSLGPWLSVEWNPAEAATEWELTATLLLTNREYPLEMVPLESLLLNASHEFTEAGAFAVYPTTYYAGPIRLLLSQSVVATLTAKLEVETGAGVWVPIDTVAITGAETKVVTMVAPLGAWRVVLEATAATTAICRATASSTGST